MENYLKKKSIKTGLEKKNNWKNATGVNNQINNNHHKNDINIIEDYEEISYKKI